jgi:dihydrofolate reductase
VASTTLTELTWQNAHLIEGDVPAAIAGLKEQDGPELQVHGSGNLLQTLLGHGLVDELRVWLFPLVLGFGKRLFEPDLTPTGLTLVDTKVAPSGVIIATYRPGAQIKRGSFVPEDPSEAELARRAAL